MPVIRRRSCPAPQSLRSSVRAAIAALLLGSALPVAAQSVFLDGFETPTEGACSDPLIAPQGWDTQSSSWQDAWSVPGADSQAVYPNSGGFPTPIGANKGKIKVINFVPNANQTVDLTWDSVQATEDYYPRPARSMFISISPCPGDVRAPVASSPDPFLRAGCRQVASGSTMFFTTQPGNYEQDIVCTLQAGTMYFMNIAPIDPSDGLTLGEHTCDDSSPYSEQGCDVQAVHRGY